MKQVNLIDATGVHVFEKLLREHEIRNGKIILSGVNPNVKKVLVQSGVADQIGVENIVESTADAIKLAFDKYVDAKKCTSNVYAECAEK